MGEGSHVEGQWVGCVVEARKRGPLSATPRPLGQILWPESAAARFKVAIGMTKPVLEESYSGSQQGARRAWASLPSWKVKASSERGNFTYRVM